MIAGECLFKIIAAADAGDREDIEIRTLLVIALQVTGHRVAGRRYRLHGRTERANRHRLARSKGARLPGRSAPLVIRGTSNETAALFR